VFAQQEAFFSYNTIDPDEHSIKTAKTYQPFASLATHRKEQDFHSHTYAEHGRGTGSSARRFAALAQAPCRPDLKPNERCIDVNLMLQTLVAFEGEHAI